MAAWQRVSVPNEALIEKNEKSAHLRMPNGTYENYTYYFPARLVRQKKEKDGYWISVPEDITIKLFGKDRGGKDRGFSLNADDYLMQLTENTDYTVPEYTRPCEYKISKVEKQLRENIPQEMKDRPNWVTIRTGKPNDAGHISKLPISAVNGKCAKSDDPATWTDFETALKYAKENGCDTVAYALDGKDGICCVDIDKCRNEDGSLNEVARCFKSVMPASTYVERSVSGSGLHFIGKLENPPDVKTFSKNTDCEFYRKTHFISITGQCENGAGCLANWSTPEVRFFITSRFDKSFEALRRERESNPEGHKGSAEGVSVLEDKELLERAFASKNGDMMRRLYDGEDVKNNRSNSDMALMYRLAFWCNGDKEQMLRIFRTSGLYRADKTDDYYEYTASKALLTSSERYAPGKKVDCAAKNVAKCSKPANGNDGKDGK